MRTLFERSCDALFGADGPINLREPAPMDRSERFMAFGAAVFLIAAALFLCAKVVQTRAYCDARHEDLLRRCILSTKDFGWCWTNFETKH